MTAVAPVELDTLIKMVLFFDGRAQVVYGDRPDGTSWLVAHLSLEYDGRHLLYFEDVGAVPAADSFVEVYRLGRHQFETLRPLRADILYRDYRKVDSSHINKLTALMEQDIFDITVGGQPALYGTMSLPGGFVVGQGINKTAAGARFDRAMGSRYLLEDLSTKTDDKLWELEGYRVYRIVNTLDSISTTLRDGDLAVRLLANGAEVIQLPNSDQLVVNGCKLPDNIKASFNHHLTTLGACDYLRIVTLLDTYIERGR